MLCTFLKKANVVRCPIYLTCALFAIYGASFYLFVCFNFTLGCVSLEKYQYYYNFQFQYE